MTANHKILVLNGAPSSGKDTIANLLFKHFLVRRTKFSGPLKSALKGIFQVNDELELEANKDKITPAFFDVLTYRQLQIDLSEKFMKPRFGPDVFGRLMLRTLAQPTNCPMTVISDSGFIDELIPLRKVYGVKNIYVLKLTRKDTSFTGDSRGYLDLDSSWQCRTFANDLPMSVLPRVICQLVYDWLDVKPSTMILDKQMSFNEVQDLFA